MCKGAAIKNQLLSGFNHTKNDTVNMKAWQTKMQIRKKNGQEYLVE